VGEIGQFNRQQIGGGISAATPARSGVVPQLMVL
jgi:hypothetical protein